MTHRLTTAPPFLWLAIFGSIIWTSASVAGTWKTFDGQVIKAEVIEFDYATKMVSLENPETKARTSYKTNDLDFASKRMLLFSPVFHQSYPEDSFWLKEKLWLFALAILSPVVLLISGMWLSGLFIARKFNPFKAIGAFLGSWIAGVILTICYLVFASKSQGGTGLIIAGIILSTLVMAMFISAMYQTSFRKGILIFLAHLFFAGFLGYVVVFGADKVISRDSVTNFWEEWVFTPTGLVDGPPRQGY